ncbi:MAG: endonuclease/exonuclease/phosphatase family protein [Phycisphaerales bacterium]|nr:endonuclease/exonuclease/phosphatase family protein [Phycisphaerales bacterium]
MAHRLTIGRLAAIMFVALVGSLGFGGCASAPPPEPLRVMTYNIRHGAGMDGVIDLERIAAVIVGAAPDVVALQEVDRNAGRSGVVDQASELARLTGLEHHAFGPFMDFDGGQYGMAILSRHPIESSRVIDLPPGAHEPRTALWASIARPRAPFVLVGVHFDWLADDVSRWAQAEALVRALATESRPLIVAGDFNDVPGSRTIERLDRTWLRIPKVRGSSFTFPSPSPEREIDFIYARVWSRRPTGLARVIDERAASDHRPVVATIAW